MGARSAGRHRQRLTGGKRQIAACARAALQACRGATPPAPVRPQSWGWPRFERLRGMCRKHARGATDQRQACAAARAATHAAAHFVQRHALTPYACRPRCLLPHRPLQWQRRLPLELPPQPPARRTLTQRCSSRRLRGHRLCCGPRLPRPARCRRCPRMARRPPSRSLPCLVPEPPPPPLHRVTPAQHLPGPPVPVPLLPPPPMLPRAAAAVRQKCRCCCRSAVRLCRRRPRPRC